MKVVILAGGMGTRLQEETVVKPKPMVEIGSYPILWHIMKIYASYGYKEFVIPLGYKGEYIKDYFINYHHRSNDLTIRLKSGGVIVQNNHCDDWIVHLVDTGINTQTGGRIKRVASLIGDEPFMVTYGDGVANINIDDLVNCHQRNMRLATVTAVRPPSRFGGLDVEGEQIRLFTEKPQIGEGWINGGFFVLEPQVFGYIESDSTPFEKAPLEQLAANHQLAAYRHEGFWQCMDTVRDVQLLQNLWENGQAPWKVWQ